MLKAHGHRLSLIFGFAALAVIAAGCSSTPARKRVFSVPVVSMTHSRIPSGYKIKVGRAISTRFCKGDAPVVETGQTVGMIDQAIHKAQIEHNATHLYDVLVMQEKSCFVLEALAVQAYKLKAREPASKAGGEAQWMEVLLPPDSQGDVPLMPAEAPADS